jgi:hypothetical protein
MEVPRLEPTAHVILFPAQVWWPLHKPDEQNGFSTEAVLGFLELNQKPCLYEEIGKGEAGRGLEFMLAFLFH